MKRIVVVTGTRAEYGLLKGLMGRLRDRADFELHIIACAMHLSPEHGNTVKNIRDDGFSISAEVRMLPAEESRDAVAKSVAVGIAGFADAYSRIDPDFVVVLGDRFEILAAAQAAFFMKIPLAHIHGGELTEGAFDDAVRHAVTKLSHLHFVSTDLYRERLLRMGESPDRVFNVGALGIERIAETTFTPLPTIARRLGIDGKKPLFLVVYHPVTLRTDAGGDTATLDALRLALSDFPDSQIIFAKPNSDPGSREIVTWIDRVCTENPGRFFSFPSLEHAHYLSLLRNSALLFGNSSSGIIEAPALGIPAINVGRRQAGRIRPEGVIDCGESCHEINRAIARAISSAFRVTAGLSVTPYRATGSTADRIVRTLAAADPLMLLQKTFYDFGCNA